MGSFLRVLLRSLVSALRSSRHLALENLALRQQPALRNRSKRPRFSPAARIFWAWLSSSWPDWHDALCLVRPETDIRWMVIPGPSSVVPRGPLARSVEPSSRVLARGDWQQQLEAELPCLQRVVELSGKRFELFLG